MPRRYDSHAPVAVVTGSGIGEGMATASAQARLRCGDEYDDLPMYGQSAEVLAVDRAVPFLCTQHVSTPNGGRNINIAIVQGRSRRGSPRLSSMEMSMDRRTISRRGFLNLGVGAGAAAALAACGNSGAERRRVGAVAATPAPARRATGSSPASRSRASVRTPSSGSTPPTRTAEIAFTEFQNDAYKTKIKTAIGAGQGPRSSGAGAAAA